MKETKDKVLHVITQFFPFGHGEAYMDLEIKYLLHNFDKVIVYPMSKNDSVRDLPAGATLNPLFLERSNSVNRSLFRKNLGLIIKVIVGEFFHTSSKKYFLKNLKQVAAEMLMALELADVFYSEILKERSGKNYFYSVWMDEGAVIMSVLKRKNLIEKFSFRLHGYDIYDERRKGQYMPFQKFCFLETTRAFIVSEAGANYLRKKKGIDTNKICVNYSGVLDNGIAKHDPEGKFSVVSCSNVIDIKRVPDIYSILLETGLKLNWTHIGNGAEMVKVKEVIQKGNERVGVTLLGKINLNEVLDFYKNSNFHLFIHLSKTEGLPLALVEAMSFGIPVVSTDVGGVSEIVNVNNGVLIPSKYVLSSIAKLIVNLEKNKDELITMRENARRTYLEKFNAEDNYLHFSELLGE